MRTRKGVGVAVAAAIAVGVTTVSLAGAQESDPSTDQPSPGQRTMAQTVTSTATVEKVDKSAGKLTVKDADDNTFDLTPGPDVNLGKLHVGDKVRTTYFQEVAIAISKPGQAPKSTEKTVQRGGVTARQSTVTAQIVSVDQKNNTVQVRGPQGTTHALKVQDPTLQAQLGKIKTGDNVDVTYTQAVAISVEPGK